jgi:coatomer subunit alpha
MLTITDPLAYMTAKSHGLDEECESILEATGLTEDQITLPTIGSPLAPPKPVVSTFKANWPTKATSQSFFEKALLGQVEGLSLEDEPAAASNGFDFDDAEEDPAKRGGNLIEADDDEDAAGWDMGDDIVPEVESDFVNVESAPASASLPPLINYVRRTVEETNPRQVLPIIPRDIESLASGDLQRGYDAMKANKLEDSAEIFRGILHALLVNTVSTPSEVDEAKRLITSASEYSVALLVELSRRKLGTPEEIQKSPQLLKKSLELSAYFTIPKLEVPHRQLALASAMKAAYSAKNYNSALSFANRMLANAVGPGKILEQVSNATGQRIESILTIL